MDFFAFLGKVVRSPLNLSGIELLFSLMITVLIGMVFVLLHALACKIGFTPIIVGTITFILIFLLVSYYVKKIDIF